MSFVLKATQQVPVEAEFEDKKGNPAPIEGTPEWSVSPDDGTVTLEVATDGMSVVVKGGKVGTAQVRVEADADLGGGSNPINGVLDVEVVAGDASVVVLNPGTPEDQP